MTVTRSKKRNMTTLAAVLLALATGCAAGAADQGQAAQTLNQSDAIAASKFTGFTQQQPQGAPERKFATDALIYNGSAAAYGDADAIAQNLTQHGATYRAVSSDELNAMSVDEIAKYGVIVWPGGYAGVQSQSLTEETRTRIRQAVRERGVSFVGFCAGSFIAVSPEGKSGGAPDYGFSLIGSNDLLPYYYLEDEGTDIAMVKASFADGSSRDLVWWGGPIVPAFPGGVIARYGSDPAHNDPMISQTWAGNGFVILSATHPEAPQNWRDENALTDSDGLDWEIAWKLIAAAKDRAPLPAN